MLVRTQRNWNPRVLLVVTYNGRSALEISMVVCYTIKHRVTIWPSTCSLRRIPKRDENIYPDRESDMTEQQQQPTQKLIPECLQQQHYPKLPKGRNNRDVHMSMNKWYVVYPCNGVSVKFSSVAQSCPTLCDPINCSMPGLPVYHQLPEFTQTHAHRVGDTIQPSHPLSSPSLPALNPSQHQGLLYSLAIKRDKVLIHATARMNYESMMLSDRTNHKRSNSIVHESIYTCRVSRRGKCTETESRLAVTKGWGDGENKGRVWGQYKGYGVPFWSYENGLKSTVEMAAWCREGTKKSLRCPF